MQSENVQPGHSTRYRRLPPGLALLLSVLAPVALASAASSAPESHGSQVESLTSWTRADAAHLIRRAGFGGTPEQIDLLYAMGREGAVDYLLTGKAPAGKETVFAQAALEEFKPTPPPEPDPKLVEKAHQEKALRRALRLQAAQGQPTTMPVALPADQQPLQAAKILQKQMKQAGREDLERLKAWWIDRMVRTDRPLEEKMTLFWHGLFTSGIKEVKNPNFMIDQNLLFHREALGNYKQLAQDIVHNGATLRYLNNDQNIKGKPNENLARELMELFTMGEGQGYTENDIKEVARALTGLTPSGGKKHGDGPAVLRPGVHDDGIKTIFGKSGNFGPDDVVNLIFARPEPAHYLARKLWQFYASSDPSDADLAPVISALEQSKYELRPALRAMFTSPAFYSEKAKFALIKSPTELAVEELRTLGMTPTEPEQVGIERRLKAMDQELLQPPNVRGWVGGDNWITAATLYTRYNTASAAINGSLQFGGRDGKENPKRAMRAAAGKGEGAPEAANPAKIFGALGPAPTPDRVVDAAVDRFLQRPLEPGKRAALLDVVGGEPLHLGDAQSDQRVRQMLCLLLSTPEYQVH